MTFGNKVYKVVSGAQLGTGPVYVVNKSSHENAHGGYSNAVTEKIEDTSQFTKIKKDIARLLTEQNARKAAATAEA